MRAKGFRTQCLKPKGFVVRGSRLVGFKFKVKVSLRACVAYIIGTLTANSKLLGHPLIRTTRAARSPMAWELA